MKGARRRWLGEGWGSEDDQNMYEMIKELIKHHVREIMCTEEKSDRLLFQSEFEMPLIGLSAEPLVFQLLALFWEAVRNLGGGASLQEGGPSGCVLSYLFPVADLAFLSVMERTTSPFMIPCCHDVLPKSTDQGWALWSHSENNSFPVKLLLSGISAIVMWM